MNNHDTVILLSGGLDSLVSLAVARETYNVKLALTFDYGQRTVQQEINASNNIAEYYQVSHEVIKLPWLKDITTTSLVNTGENLPQLASDQLDNPDLTNNSAKNVWVPNRNGVFINIAGSFADSFRFKYIVFGANKEEAATFPDNSTDFVDKINESLRYSTLVQAEVVSPLAELDKKQIVKLASDKNAPLHLLRSCYTDNIKHCGKCESCLRLKRALKSVFEQSPVEFMDAG